MGDSVNHPQHYTSHPSGVECIDVTEHMNFCLGNAMKYLWRAGQKGDLLEDLKKARWYLDREIARLEKKAAALSARTPRVCDKCGGAFTGADALSNHFDHKPDCPVFPL